MSRTAALVALLNTILASPRAVEGVSPPPLPRRAWDFSDLPYIIVRLVRADNEEDLEGPDGFVGSMHQVESWHRSYDVADQMRENIKSTVLDYSGTAGAKSIQGVNHGGDFDIYEPTTELHCCLTRYRIAWDN